LSEYEYFVITMFQRESALIDITLAVSYSNVTFCNKASNTFVFENVWHGNCGCCVIIILKLDYLY